MKSSKMLISLLVLALACGSLYAVWHFSQEKDFREYISRFTFGPRTQKKFMSPEDIVEIKIRNPGGETTFEKSKEGVWYITEPVYALADPMSVAEMPLKLIATDDSELVEEDPQDLSIYSLGKPDVEVRFRLKEEKNWHSLQFGARAPTESLYYTYNPENKRVFLTDYTLKFDFNGPYNMYLNRRLFNHHFRQVDKAIIEFQDATYEFDRDPNTKNWIMKKPIGGKVRDQFNSVIGFFTTYMAIAVLPADQVTNEEQIPTEIKITFSKGAEWNESVIISQITEDGNRFGKIPGTPLVYIVHPDILDGLRERLDDMSIILAAWFPRQNIKRIEFIRGGANFTFTREAMDKPWKLAENPDAKIDEGALWNVIYKIRAADNRGYEDASMPGAPDSFGLTNPAITVKLEFFNPRYAPLTLYYGAKDPTGKYIYTYNSQDPYILKIDAQYLNIIPKSVEELLQ